MLCLIHISQPGENGQSKICLDSAEEGKGEDTSEWHISSQKEIVTKIKTPEVRPNLTFSLAFLLSMEDSENDNTEQPMSFRNELKPGSMSGFLASHGVVYLKTA